MKILPSKRSAAGACGRLVYEPILKDREAVEGVTAHTASVAAPSTILRMVPLPREERGRI